MDIWKDGCQAGQQDESLLLLSVYAMQNGMIMVGVLVVLLLLMLNVVGVFRG